MRWRAHVDPQRWVAELAALVEEARPAIEEDGDLAALASLEHAAGYVDHNRCRQAAAFAAFTSSPASLTPAALPTSGPKVR